jgi:hypothetical protein
MKKTFYAKRVSSTSFAIANPPLHLHFETQVKITRTCLSVCHIHVTKYCACFLSFAIPNYDLTGFEEDTGAENIKEHKKDEKEQGEKRKGEEKKSINGD